MDGSACASRICSLEITLRLISVPPWALCVLISASSPSIPPSACSRERSTSSCSGAELPRPGWTLATERLGVLFGPAVGQQSVEFALGPLRRDLLEHVLHVGPRIELVQRAGREHRVRDCSALRAGVGAGEEEILPSESHQANQSLHFPVVDLETKPKSPEAGCSTRHSMEETGRRTTSAMSSVMRSRI